MPFCPKCGSELSEDAMFCPQCGASVTTTPVGAIPPVEPLRAKPPSRRLVLIAIAVITVAAISVGIYFFALTPKYPWLFRGAYAVYKARTTFLFIPVEATVRTEILDFNSTHMKLLYYFKLDSSLIFREDSFSRWVKMGERILPADFVLEKQYEKDIYVEGLGTVQATVYEYRNINTNDIMKVYVDNRTKWFIKFEYSAMVVQLDIKLVETNIPGLKKS